jgi:3-phosphoshikimate 1-carboxyvinyltransferase
MKIVRIRPSSLKGSLFLPPSKSQTMRSLFFAGFAKNQSQIRNALNSPDTKAMLEALKFLGVQVKREENLLNIWGVGGEPKVQGGHIDVGNSGLALRFLTAAFAMGRHYMMITGDASLCSFRPMAPLISGLSQMKAFCISTRNNGYAPIIVKGPIYPSKIVIEGSDSQPLSALLMAASFLDGETEICVKNPKEGPWVDLTLSWLSDFSVPVKRKKDHYYSIQGKRQKEGFQYEVPGDMSSLAFPLCAALITDSTICLQNVPFSDPQGDKKLIDVLQMSGGNLKKEENESRLFAQGSQLTSFSLDMNPFIDALPILAVVACYAKGKSYLFNALMARKKESDRLAAITKELKKMGAKIVEKKESLIIEHSPLKGAIVESHKDHRIAMALTVAALGAQGETILQGAECVEKSYPNFFEEMKNSGADIEFL